MACVATDRLTATWQFACLPNWPQNDEVTDDESERYSDQYGLQVARRTYAQSATSTLCNSLETVRVDSYGPAQRISLQDTF